MTATSSTHLLFDAFDLHIEGRLLLREGVPVTLNARAFDLLVALVDKAGLLMTKSELLEQVWPRALVEENALQVQISALRKVIGSHAIATVFGHGYRFDLKVTRAVSPQLEQRSPTGSNLPTALSRFVGREIDMVLVRQQLQMTRLLTLVGAGGCGKTRLALQVARAMLHDYEDGVWLTEFAALSDAALVPGALAAVLGIKEQPGQDLTDAIVKHLASSRRLIILDNAEHLIAPIRTLIDLVLRRCEGVTVLATSRERLALEGESTYRVPSLPSPDPVRHATLDRVKSFDAVELFVDRVRLLKPHFALTDENAADVASICHRLDGMPLAIELAAPRVRAMSVQEISQRLDKRFALLTGGSPALMNRQRTLRATVDWSYELLTEQERALLRRLSVFSGGWTLQAAEQVCADQFGLDPELMLDVLVSLVDKSLVVAEEQAGATRFTMLQTVREYARVRLREDDEPVHWQSRHLDYFLEFAEQAAIRLKSANPDAMRSLEAEHDNLRIALTAPATARFASRLLRLGVALGRFWWWGAHWTEGLGALLLILQSEPVASDAPLRAQTLQSAGALANYCGDAETSRNLYQQAIAAYRALNNLAEVAFTLTGLAMTEFDTGQLEDARSYQQEGLAIATRLADAELTAKAKSNLGIFVAEAGEFASAKSLDLEALQAFREIGHEYGAASALCNLGVLATYEGDLPLACSRFREAISILLQHGDDQLIALTRGRLGAVLFESGDVGEGVALLEMCLDAVLGAGNRLGAIEALEFTGNALFLERPQAAACLWAMAQRLRLEVGSRQTPVQASRVASRAVRAREVSDNDEAMDGAWSRGRAVPFEQMLQRSRELLSPGTASPVIAD